jgi:hypothetical protein
VFEALVMLVMAVGEIPADEREPARLAQIFIVGNEAAPQHIILNRLQLYTGQVLTQADLRAAEKRLRWLTPLGIKTSVSLLKPGGSEYKDILVKVYETPVVTYLLLGLPHTLWPRLYRPQR